MADVVTENPEQLSCAATQSCGHHTQYWNGHYCERCSEIADQIAWAKEKLAHLEAPGATTKKDTNAK